MSTRCIACRKRIKRGELFCSDCLQRRASDSARKRDRRRRGQLLELIFSLPFLSVSEKRLPAVIEGDVTTEEATWSVVRPMIQSNLEVASQFREAAVSLGIEPPAETDGWIGNMDAPTAMPILRRMRTRARERSGRDRSDVLEIQRSLLALSSSLLSVLIVVLALLSLGLFIME